MFEPMPELRVRQEIGERVRRASQRRVESRARRARRGQERIATPWRQ